MLFTANAHLFLSLLIAAPSSFRYDLVWEKSRPVGYLDANRRPLRKHEMLLVFGVGKGIYNPQKVPGKPYTQCGGRNSTNYGKHDEYHHANPTGMRHPTSVVKIATTQHTKHPTQKPVALLDWLIRTYSNPGDMVLDPVSGSATTAVAALSCGRNVTCIEKDATYFEIGRERVEKHIRDNGINARLEVRT